MFHGPLREAVPFFESLGFKCPERKDHASFLQEVTTPKGKPAEPFLWLLAICISSASLPRSSPILISIGLKPSH